MRSQTRKALLRLALLAAIGAAACGYRPLTARVPGGGERICVPQVENRTSYGGLAGSLTVALRRELARAGLEVVGAGEGAPELRVAITAVRGGPGMLGVEQERLAPVDIAWEIAAEARVADRVGEDLTRPELLTVDGRSLAGDGVTAEQTLGDRRRLELVDRLAREIVRALFEER
jgi:hypothetical protein